MRWPRCSAGRCSKGRAREFGLSFASAHLVHVGLVVWLGIILGKVPLSGGLLLFFLIALFFTYLLAALSFRRRQGAGAGMAAAALHRHELIS